MRGIQPKPPAVAKIVRQSPEWSTLHQLRGLGTGLAGFLPEGRKSDIFHGKNWTGKNRFMPELSSK